MFCKNCGAPIADGAVFCESCGTKVENSAEVATSGHTTTLVQSAPQVSGKDKVFAGIGLGHGIAGLVLFWYPVLGTMLAIIGLIFSNLGKRAKNARAGKVCSVIGLVLSIIVTMLFIALVIDTIYDQTYYQ